MTHFDFERHGDDYAAFRPGPITLELGDRSSYPVGVDTSAEQIATAKQVAMERSLAERVQFTIASAENTGLAASSFDLATAGQCWHWFDSNAAIAETRFSAGQAVLQSPRR